MRRRPTTLAALTVLTAAFATGCGSGDDKPDPMRGQQWGLDALKLPDAWKNSNGADTVIAVVDTGVDLDHPDLKGRLVDGYDFVDNDDEPKDMNGHGTHDTPVLVVNAADQSGKPASFTNFGAQNAVSAPGVDILSTLPTYTTKETLKNTTGYGKLSGTSMASPYVSAVAALLHQQGLDPAAITRTIRDSAANPRNLVKLGLGNVDAAAAVKAAAAKN